MKKNKYDCLSIPADVPASQHHAYLNNYNAITKGTDRLFLFAADHKIEHLHQDFYGPHLPEELGSPKYLFDLANSNYIGAFATHLGLIARYAKLYPHVNFIAKLNGKTPLVSTQQHEPMSRQLWTIDDCVALKMSGVSLRGIGYTIYLGSDYEAEMLHEAAQIIQQAHRVGLITMLWIYPRGHAIKNEGDGLLLAGAAGVAASLGSDFVKIKPPTPDATHTQAAWINIAQQAAGTTKVICAGQEQTDIQIFLQQLYEQLTQGNAGGAAIGRNIFQRPKRDAEKCMQAIAALIYEDASIATALDIVNQK